LSDDRVVMTLDAGGTNFVFSGLKRGKRITSLIVLPSNADHLEKCLQTIIDGFQKVKELLLPERAVAISFSFPGPADYLNGIIFNPPNFPSFKGGVPLGPMLEDYFNLPTYINNDGNLFAYGESIAGFLPEVNRGFKNMKLQKKFRNLIGITIGTGFGAGVIVNNQICNGDNSAGGEVWLMRNVLEPNIIAEESVSSRGIQESYKDLSGLNDSLSPKQIYEIAIGKKDGCQSSAIKSYDRLARVTAEALVNLIGIIDGAIVIGGGIMGASKLLLPQILKYLSSTIENRKGEKISRIISKAYSFEEKDSIQKFYALKPEELKVPFSFREIEIFENKRIPVGISRLGTNEAIMLGAYAIALNEYKEKV
jgi:glucokinase